MSMIEPYAVYTHDATIQVFPASFADAAEAGSGTGRDEAADIDLKRVVWDVDYRNEVKRRLGSGPRLR
ncbi:MAG: hypothetical protein WD100_12585 [Tistlia sp.]|uniref:hypothetical protein n=1 Tax=Tistlia sp. TaxID=3057121 RepID=UPI0034A19EB3